MSPRSWPQRIRDILGAIEEIYAFTRDMSAEDLAANRQAQRAVEMNFIVIGEAAAHMPDDVQRAHPDVPWALMKAMRNRLVHVYFEVDPQVVWDTIRQDLPGVESSIQRMLEDSAD